MSQPLTIANAQVAPVFNDLEASLKQLATNTRQAAAKGTFLISRSTEAV